MNKLRQKKLSFGTGGEDLGQEVYERKREGDRDVRAMWREYVSYMSWYNTELAKELNKFYLRFDARDFNEALQDRVEGCKIQTD